MISQLRHTLDRLLQVVMIGLMIGLTVFVVVAVLYRKFGASLSWYDEVASIMLAWITYYGAALAALKRQHLGFDGVLLRMPLAWRKVAFVVSEILVIGFFAILAWAGFEVLLILGDETLISLPWISVTVTQSVIPIGAALFVICEFLSMPGAWAAMKRGRSLEHPEIHTTED